MDSALVLRISYEQKELHCDDECAKLINQSDLVKKLTSDFVEHPLFAVFRIMGLSEIPFIESLPYTQKILDYTNRNIATPHGFSCLGGVKEIVPCYNAMLLEAYCRLGNALSSQAQAALSWIKNYQLFDRNQTTTWPYQGVCKHGGCLGKTPCYIGVGKTVRALVTYLECIQCKDDQAEVCLQQGLDYMLRHKMYQRLSNGKPISPHITDIMIPQSYALSLTDLIYIAGKSDLLHSPACKPLIHLAKEKQIAPKQWKVDYIYSYKGYVGFDTRRKTSEWISSLLSLWLKDLL